MSLLVSAASLSQVIDMRAEVSWWIAAVLDEQGQCFCSKKYPMPCLDQSGRRQVGSWKSNISTPGLMASTIAAFEDVKAASRDGFHSNGCRDINGRNGAMCSRTKPTSDVRCRGGCREFFDGAEVLWKEVDPVSCYMEAGKGNLPLSKLKFVRSQYDSSIRKKDEKVDGSPPVFCQAFIVVESVINDAFIARKFGEHGVESPIVAIT